MTSESDAPLSSRSCCWVRHAAKAKPAFSAVHQRRRVRLLLIALLVYLVLVSLAPVADWIILHPSTAAISTARLIRHELPASGLSAEVWIAQSAAVSEKAPPQAYILAFTGNAARAELTAPYFAQDWRSRPVEIWAVNYPGFGGSPGPARLKSIGLVALSAYDELRAIAGDKPILLEGRSLGTTAALYGAACRPVGGCILRNPPPLRPLILSRYGWWNLRLLAGPIALAIPPELDSLANAASSGAPAIFVLAGDDGLVPCSFQERIAQAYVGPMQVVRAANADRSARLTGQAEMDLQAAPDWLWNQLIRTK